MWMYTLKRFIWALATLLAIITLTFFMMKLIPGDPFAQEGGLPETVRQNLHEYYHLDKPVYMQYWLYVKAIFQLDFGPSMKHQSLTVNDYIQQGFPISFQLGVQALICAITFGFLFGVIAALRRNRWPDYVSMIVATIGVSVPSFILATLLIHYVAVEWTLLPVATWESWSHSILPTVSLALMPLAYIARLMRSSMLEVLSQDYMMTAKAKGLKQSTIILSHAFRNAIIPIVTVLSLITANLVTGSFIIEYIFAIPGMGEMFVTSIFNRDYPVILGATIFYSAILIFLTFIVDVLYTWIDPRMTVTKVSSG